MDQEIIKISQSKSLSQLTEVEAMDAIDAALTLCCALYGVHENPNEAAMDIFALDIKSAYPNFSENDLIYAFRLAGRRTICPELNNYGRPMNLFLIHDVLSAYNDYRTRQFKIREAQAYRDWWETEGKEREKQRAIDRLSSEQFTYLEPEKIPQTPELRADEGRKKLKDLENVLKNRK